MGIIPLTPHPPLAVCAISPKAVGRHYSSMPRQLWGVGDGAFYLLSIISYFLSIIFCFLREDDILPTGFD
jgi:hypothetical protein